MITRSLSLLGLAAILAIGGAAACDSSEQPSANVGGIPVMSVSEALAAHAAGRLPGGRVAVRGWWSSGSVAHHCAAPAEATGELELWCVDGEYGITERNEPIMVVDPGSGAVTYQAQGPHLTPFIPEVLEGMEKVVARPRINGLPNPPVPILVLGHFDDPRAGQCRPAARQLCLDRLVLDRIVAFDVSDP